MINVSYFGAAQFDSKYVPAFGILGSVTEEHSASGVQTLVYVGSLYLRRSLR